MRGAPAAHGRSSRGRCRGEIRPRARRCPRTTGPEPVSVLQAARRILGSVIAPPVDAHAQSRAEDLADPIEHAGSGM